MEVCCGGTSEVARCSGALQQHPAEGPGLFEVSPGQHVLALLRSTSCLSGATATITGKPLISFLLCRSWCLLLKLRTLQHIHHRAPETMAQRKHNQLSGSC